MECLPPRPVPRPVPRAAGCCGQRPRGSRPRSAPAPPGSLPLAEPRPCRQVGWGARDRARLPDQPHLALTAGGPGAQCRPAAPADGIPGERVSRGRGPSLGPQEQPAWHRQPAAGSASAWSSPRDSVHRPRAMAVGRAAALHGQGGLWAEACTRTSQALLPGGLPGSPQPPGRCRAAGPGPEGGAHQPWQTGCLGPYSEGWGRRLGSLAC